MVNIVFNASRLLLMLVLLVSSVGITRAQENTIPVKVFIGAMFEIGANSGDKAGEFQHWYERYWRNAQPIKVRGASGPVWCNQDGVCGAVLGMGKVRSSSSLQAILLSDRFDFSKAYFMLSGVAGAPPPKATARAIRKLSPGAGRLSVSGRILPAIVSFTGRACPPRRSIWRSSITLMITP